MPAGITFSEIIKSMKSLSFKIKENSIGWLEWDQAQSSVNLLTLSFIEELSSVLKEIELAQLKALVVISKKSKGFCAGADIQSIQNMQTEKDARFVLDAEIMPAVKPAHPQTEKDARFVLDAEITPAVKPASPQTEREKLFVLDAEITPAVKPAPPQTEREMRFALDKAHNLFCRFERLKASTIAVIHGACLGGGLEWALCFDYRLVSASPQTRLALPEVQLGLIPGLGACFRLPRLIGLRPSLSLMLTGKSLSAKQAMDIALVDERVPPFVLEGRAWELAKEIAEGKKTAHPKTDYKSRRPLSFIMEKIGKSAICFLAKKQILKKTKGFYPAPLKALEAVQSAYGRSIALKTDTEAFWKMSQTPPAQNLMRLWALMDQAKKIKSSSAPPRAIERVGVLGAGVMGRAIACLFADRGFKVRLIDNNKESLCQALRWIEQIWERKKQKRQLSDHALKQKMTHLSVSENLWGLSTLDLVIEALPENKKLKQSVIQEVSKKLNPHCLLASNTSSLRLSELAQSSCRPENFFGLHFFNPAHKMPLAEIGLMDRREAFPLRSIQLALKKLGKIPLLVKDSPGFIVNRLLVAYLTEALLLFDEGCGIERVDRCYRDQFGFPAGPFALMDKIGLTVCVESVAHLNRAGLNFPAPHWTPKLSQTLGSGEKSGAGFYIYNNKKISLNKKAEELRGSHPRPSLSDETIIQRGIYRMINEGWRLLKDGIAGSEEDIDLALVLGAGFPPFRGGPMRYARSLGLSQVKSRLEELAEQYGPRFKLGQSLS